MARDLHVTSPLMRGPDVLDVQEKLTALGYAPGRLDACYGPTTAAAVKDFQTAQRLDADGVVGVQTAAALASSNPDGGSARPASSIGQQALNEAIKHLGLKEDPPGSNQTWSRDRRTILPASHGATFSSAIASRLAPNTPFATVPRVPEFGLERVVPTFRRRNPG